MNYSFLKFFRGENLHIFPFLQFKNKLMKISLNLISIFLRIYCDVLALEFKVFLHKFVSAFQQFFLFIGIEFLHDNVAVALKGLVYGAEIFIADSHCHPHESLIHLRNQRTVEFSVVTFYDLGYFHHGIIGSWDFHRKQRPCF